MKKKFVSILAVGLLAGPVAANAELVQSSTSVFVTFRQCVSGATVCDSVSPVQIGAYGGLPGALAAQTSQVDPAYGESSGSAKLMGAPGAAEMVASVTSMPATRNGSTNTILQRYTNASASAETLTLGTTLTFKQTVPAENADFPPDGAGHSGAVVEMEIFTMTADSVEVGTTAEENNDALMSEPEPGSGYASLEFATTGPVSNVTGDGTRTLSMTVTIKPGDSIWMWAALQNFAVNGALVNASLNTNLVSTTAENPLQQ